MKAAGASCCAAVQYNDANGGRDTRWPFSRTSSTRSRPHASSPSAR